MYGANDLVIGTIGAGELKQVVSISLEIRTLGVSSYQLALAGKISTPTIFNSEYISEKVEELLNELRYDNAQEYIDLLEEMDCTISDLPHLMGERWSIGDIVDLSGNPNSYDTPQGDCYFLVESSGQISLDDVVPLDKDFLAFINMIWEGFHLQTIPDALVQYIKQRVGDYNYKYLSEGFYEDFAREMFPREY